MNAVRLAGGVQVSFQPPDLLVFEDGDDAIEMRHPRFREELALRLRQATALDLDENGNDVEWSQLINALKDHGLLRDAVLDRRVIPIEPAGRHIRRWLDSWVDDIYCDELWDPPLTAPGNANLLFGWAVENYHFSRAVLQHLSDMSRMCESKPLARRFIEHMGEEWDHPHMFSAAAARMAHAGGVAVEVEQLSPLASTAAAIRHMRKAAEFGPLVYKTCIAVLERTAAKTGETRSYYEAAADKQALPFECVAPLIEHAEADEQFSHLDSMSEFQHFFSETSRDTLLRALSEARQFVQILHLMQVNIARRYGGLALGRHPHG